MRTSVRARDVGRQFATTDGFPLFANLDRNTDINPCRLLLRVRDRMATRRPIRMPKMRLRMWPHLKGFLKSHSPRFWNLSMPGMYCCLSQYL